MSDHAYAGAEISFLNRETQTIEKMMCYPITIINLLGPDAKPVRSFKVNTDGKWKEF